MRSTKKEKNKNIYIYKFIVVILFTLAVMFVLKIAPNYIKDDIANKTNLVINNGNVTRRLKNDVIVEDGIVYISTKDIANFFDGQIYYDNKYNQIITTSETKTATLEIDNKEMTVNGADISLIASAKKIGDQFYLPFSEISKTVYNVETEYKESTNTVVLVSIDRELVYANSTKNNGVKYKPTIFSKNVDKVTRGDTLIIVKTTEELPEGWTKVTTENGKIGYVKTKTLANTTKAREDLILEPQIEGNISLVWDYFSEYAEAPQRTGKIEGVNVVSPTFFSLKEQGQGEIISNVGTAGENYIQWAHDNDYKVWALISNNSFKDTTSEIINDYKLREKFIENVVALVEEYNLDGINLDFENIYEEDKEAFSRLVIELAPRLRDIGKVLSVDVTAPDGSPDWSLCYDRNVIGKVADYIVFMAYDQYGTSSEKAGTTAGGDWVETNIKKFLNQEEVDSKKIILGMPFYTRIWMEEDGEVDSRVVDMESVYKKIPEGVQITWNDELKQNYAEYEEDGIIYKIWIEDEESIKFKLGLVNTYELAGAAYWEKDRETEEIWKIVSEMLNVE